MTGDSSNIFASAVAAIGCLIANFYSHLAPWLLLGAAENDERYPQSEGEVEAQPPATDELIAAAAAKNITFTSI